MDINLATIVVVLTCLAPGVVFLGIWDHATGTTRSSALATLAWAALVSSVAYVLWHVGGVLDLTDFADAYARGRLDRGDVWKLVAMFPWLLLTGGGLGLAAVYVAGTEWGERLALLLIGRSLKQLPNWLPMMRPMWKSWVIVRTPSGEWLGILTHLPSSRDGHLLGLEQALWRAGIGDDWIETGTSIMMLEADSIEYVGQLTTEG